MTKPDVTSSGTFKPILIANALVTVCTYCPSVREGDGQWRRLESSDALPSSGPRSHGICNSCYALHVQPQIDAQKRQRQRTGIAA